MDVVEPAVELMGDGSAGLSVLEPHPNVLAFYAGRDEASAKPPDGGWLHDGALRLGIASYAIVSGDEALVYDTHVSLDCARRIRETLTGRGVRRITVLLSHWHLDHVAGNAAFADCEIISTEKTAAHLARHREAIEAGVLDGPPAISPLVLPTRTFVGSLSLTVGTIDLDVLEADIHSDDAAVIWWAREGLLFAGDTMEDTVTFVMEPWGFARHLVDLDRLAALGPRRILPNHGDPDVIAGGGYGKGLIRATQQYIRTLMRAHSDPAVAEASLRDLIQGPLGARWITYFAAYEAVHRNNLETILANSAEFRC